MKTVRFQSIIAAAGKPRQHLLLSEPAKDRALQKALKEQRVMTVHQSTVGTKADYGTVGLDAKSHGQILIFLHSLESFAGKRIIAVNYDLYTTAPRSKPNSKSKSRVKRAPKGRTKSKTKTAKILPFPTAETEPDEDTDDDLTSIKRNVRRALKALEQGKQVAAYEILKKIAAT
ncbi:MAG: hypothetical protein U0984_02615 [Prosthecobacter sp.]|nr:hypothetical protein [Prosthecobacter sp.]